MYILIVQCFVYSNIMSIKANILLHLYSAFVGTQSALQGGNLIQFKIICIALFTIVAKQLYRKLSFYNSVVSGAGPRAVGTERGRWSII